MIMARCIGKKCEKPCKKIQEKCKKEPEEGDKDNKEGGGKAGPHEIVPVDSRKNGEESKHGPDDEQGSTKWSPDGQGVELREVTVTTK